MITDPIKFVYEVGDGVTTDFSYAFNGTVGFDADVAEDVRAAILNPDGTRDTNPNFAVLKDTYGNFTGAIRFATAPVANAVVYIYRATPQTQETEYKTSSGFDAQNVEKDFDKLTKLVQETASHTRNKTLQLDMFQEVVLKLVLTSATNQNQMMYVDWATQTIRFTPFTKGQTVITPAAGQDDKTDIMLTHLTDEGTGLPYLAFSLDQGATWKPMNFAEISAIVNSANAKAQEALDNSETAVSTANDAKAVADGIDAKAQEALDNSETAVGTSNDAKAIAQNAATDAENAVQTATNATDIANAANATAESAKTTATNANTKADVAVSTANSALQKANTAMVQSSDALADAAVSLENSEQAVATANAAKNTADGIDGKATSALTNSEQAVSTANDAKTVADGIDAKINDVQGDVDTLNTKVPSNASASNKMATAAEISNLQNQIDENALEIKGLQGAGGALTAYNFNTATPTQETLTKYAVDQIWPGNTNWAWSAANPAASTFTSADGVSRTAAEIFNSTWVNNTYDDHRWQLTNTQNTSPKVFEWADVGRDIVSVATATTAGIVRVGSGSQMVVNPTTGDISLDGTKAESIRGTIGAVATNQGTANAGKILTVGDDGNIELADGASGAGRNIGDIFYTTRTDTALAGAVEANGAQYNFADVNQGQNNVQALLESGALPSVSISEFDAKVASDGGCDSFGYDSGATYFKVPKKVGRVLVRSQKPTTDNNYTWYNLYADGWCEQGGIQSGNITISAGLEGSLGTISLPIKMLDTNYVDISQCEDSYCLPMRTEKTNTTTTFFFGAYSIARTLSNISWQVSGYAAASEYTPDKWDYQNVQVERPMVQLFNGATDEALATCTEVLSDVAGLKDMNNITSTGKETVVGWGMPDMTTGINVPATYTTTYDCWVRVIATLANSDYVVKFDDIVVFNMRAGSSYTNRSGFLPCPAGTTITTTNINSMDIFKMKGNSNV